MNESAKFESQKKKLQGICDEHHLVFNFRGDKYPLTLSVKTTGEISGQMSMLEDDDGDSQNRPDAELFFSYKDGEISYKFSQTFVISDALYNKLRTIFKKMCDFWAHYFFRDIMEKGILSAEDMPFIDDEDGDSEIIDAAFEEIKEDVEGIESYDEDGEGDSGDEENEEYGADDGDYEYDEPGIDS